ncbi:hypothetical protein ACQY0O_000442 [Thecaphora frezii]
MVRLQLSKLTVFFFFCLLPAAPSPVASPSRLRTARPLTDPHNLSEPILFRELLSPPPFSLLFSLAPSSPHVERHPSSPPPPSLSLRPVDPHPRYSMSSGNKVFAPVIFFIAAREALEASLVIGILSGMLENLVEGTKTRSDASTQYSGDDEKEALRKKKLIKKLRKIVLLGAGCGLFVAAAIGAAFLAVFYTQVNDLYGKAEELWEGIFNLIAVVLITPMALAILRANQSKQKWRKKLANAFAAQTADDFDDRSTTSAQHEKAASDDVDAIHTVPQLGQPAQNESTKTPGSDSKSDSMESATCPRPAATTRLGKLRERMTRGSLALFTIPFVTVLREGLEGIVFIGGVSLALPASSIPLPAIIGLMVGLLIGYLIFRSNNVLGVRVFLLGSTCLLLLIAAGMASRAVYYLQFYSYVRLVGDAAAESGSGPGSYSSSGYVWHFNCCNPEVKTGAGQGWGILNSLVGWNNTATYGSIFMYVGYWAVVVSYLTLCWWHEGRARLVWRGTTYWESGRAEAVRKQRESRRAQSA